MCVKKIYSERHNPEKIFLISSNDQLNKYSKFSSMFL